MSKRSNGLALGDGNHESAQSLMSSLHVMFSTNQPQLLPDLLLASLAPLLQLQLLHRTDFSR